MVVVVNVCIIFCVVVVGGIGRVGREESGIFLSVFFSFPTWVVVVAVDVFKIFCLVLVIRIDREELLLFPSGSFPFLTFVVVVGVDGCFILV